MKIITKVYITINDGMLSTKQSKIIGELTKIEIGDDMNQYNIHYNYRDDNSNLIKSDIYVLKGVDIDNQYDEIKQLLPQDYSTMTEREQTYSKYLIAFKFIMANTFTLNYTDIEEYIEAP